MNNNQINNTSYYQLPCGKFLEDFIWYKGLNFAEGSALKYAYRAGKKDGESAEKDHEKMNHYIHFLAKKGGVGYMSVMSEIDIWLDQARTWNGEEV